MADRQRMQLESLLDDLFNGEPIKVTLRNGIVVEGTVHSRHRKIKDTEIPNVVIDEGGGAWASVLDTNIESVKLDDVEWRRSGT